jgi:hypothetical protein
MYHYMPNKRKTPLLRYIQMLEYGVNINNTVRSKKEKRMDGWEFTRRQSFLAVVGGFTHISSILFHAVPFFSGPIE